MIKNIIDTTLSKENEDLVVLKLNEVQSLLPFMVGLTPDERHNIPKMGKKSLDFVERGLMYAQEHGELKPNHFNLEALERDVTLLIQVKRMLGVMEPLCEKLNDTYMVLGAEAFHNARVFYQAVKLAAKAGVAGADAIYKDMAARYKKQASKPDTIPQTIPAAPPSNQKVA